MPKEIVTIENLGQLVPTDIFSSGGIQPILDAIKKEISTEVPDTTTDKGRKAIASNASKVSRSKTLLDDMGKTLTDVLNAQIKPINAERKLARDTLDALRDETRLPLTQYEAKQKEKLLEEAAALASKKLAEQLENDHEMGLLLNDKLDRDNKEAFDLAEKTRIEREAIEAKELAERNEKIALEAAEAEKARNAQAIKDAEEETRKAEQRVIDQAEIAKQEAKESAERVESDRIAAEFKAALDKQAAIDAEVQRQHDQKVRDDKETERREANLKHSKKINNEALACFEKGGLSKADAKLAVELIAKKMIANVVINY